MIALTESAALKIIDMLKSRDDIGIRPAVRGGGCSGFSSCIHGACRNIASTNACAVWAARIIFKPIITSQRAGEEGFN